MGSPFVGEIRMFAGNFAPANWAFCNGALMSIAQNETLFNLIGTTYGGDGQNTFALPNLQSRVPIHQGNNSLGDNYVMGQLGGVENVTLTSSQIGQHSHAVRAVTAGGASASPAGALPGQSTSVGQAGTLQYGSGSEGTTLAAGSIGVNVGGQSHSNIQPYLCVSFIISLFGIFPSQS